VDLPTYYQAAGTTGSSVLPCGLSILVLQQLAVLLSDSNHKLVNGHGGIDGHLATKVVLDIVFFDGLFCIVANDL
jgi:hypothetical protein